MSAWIPPGTRSVGLGLVVTGVSAYGYLVLTARILGPKRYVPLSVLWAAVFVAGPGLFLPLQQEVGRLYAHRRLEGVGGGPVLRRATLAGTGLVILVLVALVALFRPTSDHLFEGQSLLVIGFASALVGYLLLSLLWGGLAGSGRFGYYAAAQSGDSCLRLLICVALAIVGVNSAGPYGLVLGGTPIVAAVLVLMRNTDLLSHGPPADWGDLSSALGWLLVGSVGAQLLANGPVIAVKLLSGGHDQSKVGSFLAGLVLARVPLFLFGAVQAALLPRLVVLARSGQNDEFRAGLTKLAILVSGIALAATLFSFTVGPQILSAIFGSRFSLGRLDLGLLAAGSGLYMLVLVLAQPLIALGLHTKSAIGWLLGLVSFAMVTSLGGDLLLRVELGFLTGVVVALGSAGLLLWRSARDPAAVIDPEALPVAPSSLELEP